MKKILAVVLSLAMIFSMSVVGFAAEDTTDWTTEMYKAYYVDMLTLYGFEDEEGNPIGDDVMVEKIVTTTPQDVTFLEYTIADAIRIAREDGTIVENRVVLLNEALRETHGLELETALYEDIDGDGYIGNPAENVVYIPTSKTDVEAWTTYYTIVLGEAATNPTAVITVVPEIAGTVTNGLIDMDTFTSAFPEAAKNVGGDVVNQIVWGVEELLRTDLNSDNYIGKPDGSMDDVTLPEEDESTDSGSDSGAGFLDTILGILGSIADMIFGGGNGGGDETPTDPDDDGNLWDDPDDSDDPFDTGDDSTIPSTGDTTVIAVAAVALAAGAALVMTRKKSEDAE